MKRTRIKICGITNSRDAQFAVTCGADALGFQLYDKSPRYVDCDTIAGIVDQLPPYVTRVGLLVNHTVDEINRLLEEVNFDLLQFHGDESDEFCHAFGIPFIKAIRVEELPELEKQITAFPNSKGILLDAFSTSEYGGTGKTINWSALPAISGPVVLAGGLSADNVGDAIKAVRPFAVDVSSGVESEKGIKDHGKMSSFILAVWAADSEVYDEG